MTAFVGLLALLSANDFWVGQVDTTRLFSHALIVLGYVIVLMLNRPSLDLGDPPPQQRARAWRVDLDDADQPPARRCSARYPVPVRSRPRRRPAA